MKRFFAGGSTGKILKTVDADGPEVMVAGNSWGDGGLSGTVAHIALSGKFSGKFYFFPCVQFSWYASMVVALALQNFGGENEIFEGTRIGKRDCFRRLVSRWMWWRF
ncbi:MAG: hypothetical protein ABSD44_04740 [Terracidiphilus sp.]